VAGQEQRRQYSLSAASNGADLPHQREARERRPGVQLPARQVQVGDTLSLFPPAGDFVLAESDKPLVLISGGVGITPTLAMLTAALKGSRPVHFIHAARHAGVHAFREHIDALADKHPQLKRFYCYEKADEQSPQPHATGYLNPQQLAKWLPETRDVDAYFLGPKPFMKAIKSQLAELGVPATQTHYEFFGPAEALA
jgi:nitric oxide dioxygenase